ncbi:histone-lysine N-methyltransferase SETMAR [Trichonephila clavipes]|nr:histone-lysine N-methyltransferase SETMAR [Trichonephila clavipes]
MDVLKKLVRCCLIYDFKVGLSTAASSRRICQAFWDSAVNERMARHWFQKFRSGDVSLCDKTETRQSQALDNEALQAAIQDSRQMCGELFRQFNTSSEMIRLHPHRLGPPGPFGPLVAIHSDPPDDKSSRHKEKSCVGAWVVLRCAGQYPGVTTSVWNAWVGHSALLLL